jgi:hypothetical protein
MAGELEDDSAALCVFNEGPGEPADPVIGNALKPGMTRMKFL